MVQLINDLYTDLDASKFAEELRSHNDATLIDVRTPWEFAEGHIPRAENFDISNPLFPRWIQRLSRRAPCFVYCSSGARSLTACELLVTLGFERVYNLQGGLVSWSRPLESDNEEDPAGSTPV